MSIDTSALRKLAGDATPGPWFETAVGWLDSSAAGFGPVVDLASAVPADAEFIAAASPDVVIALLDRLEMAEKERDLLHEVRAQERDADAPMPPESGVEWGTSDYNRHAVLFNDITYAPTQQRLRFSDRLRLQRYLWAQGWRREVRPKDSTEHRSGPRSDADAAGAPEATRDAAGPSGGFVGDGDERVVEMEGGCE